MKTLTQIATELGYASVCVLRQKIKKAGVDLSSLERYVGGYRNSSRLYSKASEEYIKSVAGQCRTQKPKLVKDSDSKLIQPAAKKAEKKDTPTKTKKVAKSKVSVPKATKADKVQAASPITTTTPVSQVNLDHRLQQLQVLGEVLVAQINQLTSEVSGQATKQVATATYSVAS